MTPARPQKLAMADNLSTTEARAVQKHFGQLMTAIQEPQIPALAAAFFSDSIVAADTMQVATNAAVSKAVRCTALLLAVVNHVEVHPERFEQVVGILSQETNMTELATRISVAYRKYFLLSRFGSQTLLHFVSRVGAQEGSGNLTTFS